MTSEVQREAEELWRYYTELGRRLAQTGVRDVPDLLGLYEQLQRALDAVSRQEIEWALDTEGRCWLLQSRGLQVPKTVAPPRQDICETCALYPVLSHDTGVVAHAGVISSTLAWYFPEERGEWWLTIVRNCSLTRLAVDGAHAQILGVDETQHLHPEEVTTQPPDRAVQVAKAVVPAVRKSPVARKRS